MKFREIKSSFKYTYISLKSGAIVAVVIDECSKGKESVVDDMENINQFLGCDIIVFLNHNKCWSFWSLELGFKSLHVAIEGSDEKISPPSAELAVEIAENRYIRKKFSDSIREYCTLS